MSIYCVLSTSKIILFILKPPFLFFFPPRVLGLLICPKIAEAKIMIKHSAFLYTPQCAKKQTNKKKQTKKTSVGKKWFCTWEETI